MTATAKHVAHVQAARAQQDDVGLGLLDETDAAYSARLFQPSPAFYLTADCRPPDGR